MVESAYRPFDTAHIAVVHLRLLSLEVAEQIGVSLTAVLKMERTTACVTLVDVPFNFPFLPEDEDAFSNALALHAEKMDAEVSPLIAYEPCSFHIVPELTFAGFMFIAMASTLSLL